MVTSSGWKIQHPEISNEGEAWSFDEGFCLFILLPTQNQQTHTHTHSDTAVADIQLSKSALGVTGQTFLSPPNTALPLSLSMFPAALQDQTRTTAGCLKG